MGTVDQALVLASLGLPVFPCRPDKKPACAHGVKDATRDLSAIVRMFREGMLIGVACGPRSGLAVLDGDTTRHAEAAAWLKAHHHRLPGRLFVTRSGGVHLWFRWVPGVVNCAGRPVLGIDARGDGGYVIWWGGDDVGRAAPVGLVDWPEWLRLAIWPPPKPRPAAPRKPRQGDPLMGLMRCVENANPGERNNVLHWAACRAAEHIAEGAITEAEARQDLTAAALYTGLSAPEIQATLRSAFQGGNR